MNKFLNILQWLDYMIRDKKEPQPLNGPYAAISHNGRILDPDAVGRQA